MEIISSIILIIGTMVPAYILHGFILMKLVQWFLLPLGVPELTLAHYIGISIIVNFATRHYYKEPKEADESVSKSISFLYLNPLIVLFIGWIVSWFV